MRALRWCVAGYFGPRVAGALFDADANYERAFWVATALAVVALLGELLARRPKTPTVALTPAPAAGS